MWLCSCNISDYFKACIKDLLFDVEGLFSTKTDKLMENFYKKQTTTKYMGIRDSQLGYIQ